MLQVDGVHTDFEAGLEPVRQLRCLIADGHSHQTILAAAPARFDHGRAPGRSATCRGPGRAQGDLAVSCAVVGARRRRRRPAGARDAGGVPGPRASRARRLLRPADQGILARSARCGAGCGRLPPGPVATQPDPATACGGAAPPGAFPAPEHGGRRHGRAARDAPPGAQAAGRATALGRHRCRPGAPVQLVVQPRLPGVAADRLAHLGDRAGKADQVRGGARDPGLARPAAQVASRPALLRVFPPGAARRAGDLHRGGAHARRQYAGAAAAGAEFGGGRSGIGRLRDLLLDHQLPGRPAGRVIRQPADQAGRRGPGSRISAAEDLRYAVPGPGFSPVAGRKVGRVPGSR